LWRLLLFPYLFDIGGLDFAIWIIRITQEWRTTRCFLLSLLWNVVLRLSTIIILLKHKCSWRVLFSWSYIQLKVRLLLRWELGLVQNTQWILEFSTPWFFVFKNKKNMFLTKSLARSKGKCFKLKQTNRQITW